MGGPGSGKKPREYPPAVVELVCGMYRDGMTVAEIRTAAPKGYRIQTILERYLPERRAAAKRNQGRDANHMWNTDPGYQAAHLRVAALKGKASEHRCVDCGRPAADWSYVHGCAGEVRIDGRRPYCTHADHYAPRCRKCHRAYDRQEVTADV